MSVNIVKLCVGAASLEDLQAWIDFRMAEPSPETGLREHYHITRMTPKRETELLNGGSLYWVIKGTIQARQRIRELRPITDDDGIARCKIVLDPELVPTHWQPRRAFQGWRYLKPEDAPADLGDGGQDALPLHLKAELADLGLL